MKLSAHLLQANALRIPLADGTVQTCVTSPPYFGLRDYGVGDQIGLEPTLQEYIENICAVMAEVWRVLRDDGTVWLNLGDSYNGSGGAGGDYNAGGLKEGQPRYPGRDIATLKPKDLIGVPWRVALALQERGWYLRSDIIWHKPNPMPESVRDRPTKSHEYLFLLSKQKKYYYDADAIREESTGTAGNRREFRGGGDYTTQGESRAFSGKERKGNRTPGNDGNPAGRNKRTVWTVTTKPYSGAHFATFPPDLIEPCILAGTSEKGQCPECGAPWERVTEKEMPSLRKVKTAGPIGGHGLLGGNRFDDPINIKTTGWRPTCGHEHEPVPQIVLDPFGGSGTTAMVAQKHNRTGICLDLSWEYLQLAKERCGIKQFDEFYNGKKAEANWNDLPLFS